MFRHFGGVTSNGAGTSALMHGASEDVLGRRMQFATPFSRPSASLLALTSLSQDRSVLCSVDLSWHIIDSAMTPMSKI